MQRYSDDTFFKIVKISFESAFNLFKKGEIQILSTYSLSQPSLLKGIKANIIESGSGKNYFIAFNTQKSIFRSDFQRVQFLNLLDLQPFFKTTLNDGARISTSMVGGWLTMPKIEELQLEKINNKIVKNEIKILIQKNHSLERFVEIIFKKISSLLSG